LLKWVEKYQEMDENRAGVGFGVEIGWKL